MPKARKGDSTPKRKKSEQRRETDRLGWESELEKLQSKIDFMSRTEEIYPSLKGTKILDELGKITSSPHLNALENLIALVNVYEKAVKLLKTDEEKENMEKLLRMLNSSIINFKESFDLPHKRKNP